MCIRDRFKYYARLANAGSLTTGLYFNNEDDAVSPTTYTQYNDKTLTGSIGWVVSDWVSSNYYESPDISIILQDIIDRPGWVSGNAVMLLHKWASGDTRRIPRSYDYSSALYCPELIVTWILYKGYFSGYTFEQSNPVSRKLYLYERPTGDLVTTTTSSGDGYYYMETASSGSHNIVCLDDVAGVKYNDIISGNIFPTTVSG